MKKDDEKKVPRKDYRLFTVYDIQVEEGFNPRQDFGDIDELARDISVNGVLVPLHGFIKKGDTKYTLTDGHRRFMAAQIVQKNNPDIELRIPLIAHKVMSEEQRLFNVLSFNGGKNLNPLEESDVVNRLINFGMNDKEIIKRTGMTSVYISNLKLLYSCPQKIKNLISSSVVTATLAMDVLRNSKSFEEAVEIIEKGVSFAKSEGKEKLVKKDLEKSQGKVNSYSAMCKCFKSAAKNEKVVRQDRIELYDFATKIINGNFTKEDFEEFFYEC